LTAEGESWAKQRRRLQPAFHREHIEAYVELMVAEAERMLAYWHDSEKRDVHHDMVQLTSRTIAACLFGTDLAERFGELHAAVEAALGEAIDRYGRLFRAPVSIPTPANLRYRRALRRLNKAVHAIIRDWKSGSQNSCDLLSTLLHAAGAESGRKMDGQSRDEVVTLFLAGYETTALTLSWVWYLLSEHPTADSELAAELHTVLGGRRPTVADLAKLRYAEMVVMESMRLYPPAYAIGREAVQECEIGGYRIPARTTLFLSQWVTHRDPRYFDEPEKFIPERWTGDFARRLPKYAYFPFGGGPRLCIGNSFALMETVFLLATIAQKFRLVRVPSHIVTPWPSMTLRPRHGVQVVLQRR
jgi:cytochrome P450